MYDEYEDLDDESLALYGQRYKALSPFGQSLVRSRLSARPKTEITMEHVDLAQALQVAHAKIAKLEQENRDLWQDNEDLQLRLLDTEDGVEE